MSYHPEIATIADVPRFQARDRGDSVAFVCADRVTTYQAFDAHCSRVAQALLAAGMAPQSRIAYIGKNSDYYFEVLFGAAKANVVMVPVNWRLAPPEIAYIVNDSGAEILFVGPEFVELAAQARAAAPGIRRVVVMTEADYGAWRDAQPATDPNLPQAPRDVAVQLYTSGTTGNPKGAQLAHVNFLGGRQALDAQAEAWNTWGPEDVSLVAMPIFHIGGTGWGFSGLYAGARNIVIPEFSSAAVLDCIRRHRITKIFMVPAAMKMVLDDPTCAETDFSCIGYILYGASPIPLDLLRRAIQVFKCGFVQMYGMTETTGTIVYLPPEDHDPAGNPRMRSAGKPYPNVEIKIVDGAGRALPPGEVGEICIRSVQNMMGYWNLPEATAKTIDADGWLHSGDAGYLDDDGYVYIHDRVKDMIVSGAENIYPAEVESAIYGHPAIADVAVIGVPDDRWGEAVKAVVALKPGMTATAEEIIAFARQRIAGFKAPKSVDFVPTLPRNASGKLLKKEIRAPFWAGRERMVN